MWPSSETGLVIAARLGNSSRHFVFLRNSTWPSLQLRDDRRVDRDASDSGLFFAVVWNEIGLCGIRVCVGREDRVRGIVQLEKRKRKQEENKSGSWWERKTPSSLGLDALSHRHPLRRELSPFWA
ncbi:hypothetical protein CSHISOI_06979 [Colletotrichum shisoi]|uniref:Uncharacterized protein n=1 Tax=Colletotrichum shisoi TaxID=2078593 RepID=A0A5Q4BN89_9PEZI|nr:hypothetical protein CSHISOI_06979 [Colletotrichum shisoi]